jgi:hypothetical protein
VTKIVKTGYRTPTPIPEEEMSMGLLANLTKLGVAKKAFDTARKPENQARIKSALSKVSKGRKSH